MPLQCEIVTPENTLYANEAHFVVLPGAEGEMGVYVNHQPIVTALDSGSVRVTPHEGEEPQRFVVAGGFAQIDGKRVTILADRAAEVASLDVNELRTKIAELETAVVDLTDDDPAGAFTRAELDWNNLLLENLS